MIEFKKQKFYKSKKINNKGHKNLLVAAKINNIVLVGSLSYQSRYFSVICCLF